MTEKHTFYVPPTSFEDDRLEFIDGEARHASRVLRLSPGNEVQVVNGEGRRFQVRMTEVGRSRVRASIVAELPGEPDIRPRLTLAVGLLKQASRYEMVLEKAAELGVNRVIPLISERTETARLRMDRARHILVAAMKQCGRARLVALDEPTRFRDALDGRADQIRLVCHESADPEDGILTRLREAGTADSVFVLVGSEGGFTGDEIEMASESGCRVVSLGPTRLRTETAAIAASVAVLLGSTA